MKQSEVEYLFTAEKGAFDAQSARVLRTVEITAGDTLEIEAFPALKLNRRQKRAARRAATREAQHRINQRHRKKRLRRLIAANFTRRDFFVTLTFNYGVFDRGFVNLRDVATDYERMRMPWTIDDAHREFYNWIRRIRRLQQRRESSHPVRFIAVIEATAPPAEGLPPKYHVHVVISCPSVSMDELDRAWNEKKLSHGLCSMSRVVPGRSDRVEGKCADSLAAYMCKSWTESRLYTSHNLVQPTMKRAEKPLHPALAARIATAVQMRDPAVFAAITALHPGYCVEAWPEVYFSEFLPGAFFLIRLRRTGRATGAQPMRARDKNCLVAW